MQKKMKQKKLFVLCLACFLLPAIAGWQQAQAQNPVWDHDFPDPTVIRTPEGMYYAYATQGGYGSNRAHIQVARSKDGIHWEWVGDALPDKPQWASASDRFWAPHALYDKPHKRYVLYYAAESDDDSLGMCIGVAVSPTPEGPFRDKGTALLCGKGFEAIDPMAFEDPKSGRHYLYWGSDFKPIRVRELSADWLNFAPGSEASVALRPNVDHDYDKLIEGPWVIPYKGHYFMFYSGDNCCGANAHYAVMVARADRPEGPFTRYSEASGTKSSVVLQGNEQWMAPGHNSVVADAKGNLWMYYHAINTRQFRDVFGPGKRGGHAGRVMLRDRIVFKNGWPAVGNGSPSFEK